MNTPAEEREVHFEKALAQADVSEAIRILERQNKSSGTPLGADKVKALRVVQRLAPDADARYHWAVRLLDHDSAAARDLAAMLTATFIGPLYTQQPQTAEEIILRIAVAMAFSTAEAARHVDAALPILERLALDGRRFVWRAVASAMRNLGRRAPKVVPVLKR